MTKIISAISHVLIILNLSSCSCAIYNKKWKADGSRHIMQSTHDAFISEVDLPRGVHPAVFKNGSSGYTNNGVVVLHSSLCPTLLTILSGGKDIERWNQRCHEAERVTIDWFAKRGIALKPVDASANYCNDEQAAHTNPLTAPIRSFNDDY